MAKIAFTKLNLKKMDEVKNITINEQSIEIKQYLPMNEKIDMVTRVVNSTNDNNNFVNPLKVEVILTLEIIMTYTNINFTDKQKEDISKLYDLFSENGIIEQIFNSIPEEELDFIINYTWDTIESIYEYHNSILGILEAVSNNKEALELNTTKIQEALKDPENLELLKDVLTKLG